MEFKELKRKKERGVSNEEFMDQSKDFFKDAESIVVVGVGSDGIISTFYTQSSFLNCIGMMEVAKEQLIKEMEI